MYCIYALFKRNARTHWRLLAERGERTRIALSAESKYFFKRINTSGINEVFLTIRLDFTSEIF